MNNVLRTLIYDDEVSLTLIDGTALAREGARIHGLSKASATVFSKCLLFTAFMSACLKEERGDISLAVKGDGEVSDISVSGNRALRIRGSINAPTASDRETDAAICFPTDGSLTVIRNDGYSRPFVGACQAAFDDLDENFEEYYRISEQLPTFIKTAVEFNADGAIEFAGIAVLQPLPFASEKTLSDCAQPKLLASALKDLKEKGVEQTAIARFAAEAPRLELRTAEYKCNCSRSYLSGVLVSVGKDTLKQIVREDGAVKVHCHYCNSDYEFTDDDVEKMFEE